ncbi:MAG: YlbL family protein [Acidimicrobiales bacterium]
MVAIVVVVLVAAGFAANSITLDEYVFSPGVAQPVGPLITVPSGKAHTPHGNIYLTDIFLTRVRALQLPLYLLNGNDAVYSSAQVFGQSKAPPPTKVAHQEALQMVVSSELARVVALRALGYPVPERNGALIAQVVPGSPAGKQGRLVPGDAVTAVDGHPTTSADAAVDVLHTLHPGQTVTLTVHHTDGALTHDRLTLGHTPKKPSVPFAGVAIETGPYFVLPFQVKINSDGIGGPSAGLAFTLGIINQLTNGRLTGGHRVAATGTISLQGQVGTVGGVPQKTIAVRNAGATVFLVPPDNYHQALSKAGPDLKVISVATLSQALAALRSLGGKVPPTLHLTPTTTATSTTTTTTTTTTTPAGGAGG